MAAAPSDAPAPLARGRLLALATAFAAVEFLPAFGGPYGYFLDEFYYLACAKRLAFGYVDHPPLAPWILRANVALLGDSIPALRLLPALAGGAMVFLCGWMAWRMGGGAWAQGVAALCVVVAPIPLLLFGFFSMNAFDLLLWSGAGCLLIELCRCSGDGRLWAPLGLLLGLAFENKHTSGLLAGALVLATLLTPLRRHLGERWLWIGAALALALAAPNLAWQAANGWPSLEFYENLDRESNIPVSALAVFGDQVAVQNPATFPVWAAGLVLLFSARGRRYRAAGWVFAAVFVVFRLAGKSRPDRIAGAYPLVFSAGAIALEALSAERRRWIRAALPAALIAVGALFAPLVLPFPPDWMAAHPLAAGTNDARREVGVPRLPLPFSHRLGSEEFVDAVAGVFRSLEPGEQRQAILLAGDFAHAGALEHFGPRRGLPPVFSPHNSYYLWGPEPGAAPAVVIAMALDERVLREAYDEVEEAAVYHCRDCMGWRDNLSIWVARRPRGTLGELWPRIRRIGLPTRKLLMLEAGER